MTKNIVAIGEALWDIFPNERHAGGAPTNVAFHCARLGDHSSIITRVGDDEPGEQLVAYLPYSITTDVAWDYIDATEAARDRVCTADAVCYVSLAQRHDVARRSIRRLLSDARGQTLLVFDVNLRPPFVSAEVLEASLQLADVVKLGEAELDHLSNLLGRTDLVEWLTDEVGVSMVCITRGAEGASLVTKSTSVNVPGVSVDTSTGDAVGAGDAFLAALTHQLVRRANMETTLQFANRYAALVATKRGAMPSLTPSELSGIGA
jgi:fructokinase